MRVFSYTFVLCAAVTLSASPAFAQKTEIHRMSVHEPSRQLRIVGTFGSAKGGVFIDNVSRPILYWSQDSVVCSIEDTGKGSCGPVQVGGNGYRSAARMLTSWRVLAEYEETFFAAGPYSTEDHCNRYLHFRGELESYYLHPDLSPKNFRFQLTQDSWGSYSYFHQEPSPFKQIQGSGRVGWRNADSAATVGLCGQGVFNLEDKTISLVLGALYGGTLWENNGSPESHAAGGYGNFQVDPFYLHMDSTFLLPSGVAYEHVISGRGHKILSWSNPTIQFAPRDGATSGVAGQSTSSQSFAQAGEPYIVQIVDLSGRLVMTLPNSTESILQVIARIRLPLGKYLVAVRSGGGSLLETRLIER
jgi:hypothetical protein